MGGPPPRANRWFTRSPWEIIEADIEALGAASFDDRAIHDIARRGLHLNRVADGLGVELESEGD